MNTAFFFFNLLFNLVVISAIICFLITCFRIAWKRDVSLLPFAFFYLLSASVSGATIFNNPGEEATKIQKTFVYLFYTFDFLFFLLFTRNFIRIEKLKLNILFLITLFSIPIVLYFENRFLIIQKYYYDICYQFIIVSLTIPIILRLYKDEESKIIKTPFEFWFISAFFFYSFSTLIPLILSILGVGGGETLILAFCYATIYLAWIIKYYLLLKSVLCKKISRQ